MKHDCGKVRAGRLPAGMAGLVLAASLLLAPLVSPAGDAATPAATAPAAQAPAPEIGSGRTGKALVRGREAMVVTAHPLASRAADRLLAAGGSAVDAAIAAQLVLTLVEPQSSGIGGGGFMLVHQADSQRLRVFDGRETAPAAARPDQFLQPDGKPMKFFDAVDSGLSVGVPGLLRMLDLAHRGAGRLPWPQLFEPAIELAENGFAVSDRLHESIQAARRRLAAQPSTAAYFLDPDGAPWPVGHLLRNPGLAEVLREIAADGASSFYSGPTAAALVAQVRAHPVRPGVMDLDDLAKYRALERDPLCAPYRAFRVCGMPPPSSGALTVLQTLSMLAGFDLAAMSPDGLDTVHLVSEAYRLAYADRARFIADPAFATVPTRGLLEADYGLRRASQIRMDQSMGTPQAGEPAGAPVAGLDAQDGLPATTHLSIVDAQGNAVSMTSSIEHAFGSAQMVRGFLLNNQLTDFSFQATDADGRPVANRVEPGKRPRSSMAPTMVFDERGRLEAVIGSPGGSAIIQYVTRALLALIDWRQDIQQAVSAAHFGATTSATTVLEKGTSMTGLADGLQARGHTIRLADQTSGLHGIVFNGLRDDGKPGLLGHGDPQWRWHGGADPRREGLAIGR
ncbi:MAG: gamma-glutamyltransferase [Burkholderiaceae bacterium]